MQDASFSLLKTRRFWPLFLTQFCGAFNDNLLKNALIIFVAFQAQTQEEQHQAQIMVTLASGLFILPYFLFSAMAGQIADKFEKTFIIRLIKQVEIVLMLFAALGFFLHQTWILLIVLFAMGAHSAFFGPLKYSILPDHLQRNELIGGNAMVEAGTFIAILLGTLSGGLLVMQEQGPLYVSAALMAVALTGWLASRVIPMAKRDAPDLRIQYNVWQETWAIIQQARQVKSVYLSILGISWFWLVGAVFLSQFASLTRQFIHGDETVVTFFLALFSIGIGLGSVLCSKWLKGKISAAFVSSASFGMAVFTGLFYAFILRVEPTAEAIGFSAFLTDIQHLPLILCLLGISVCGGLYIVPLYTIMQADAPEGKRSRIIAANNVLNALFMVSSAIVTILLLQWGFTVADVLLVMAVLNLPVALWMRRLIHVRQPDKG